MPGQCSVRRNQILDEIEFRMIHRSGLLPVKIILL
jgi:hypothetical protein